MLAVVGVVHFNGAPSTDVRSRISGSKALRDAARSVLVCGTDPNDESRLVMVQDKHSFGPKSSTGHAYRIETRHVERDGETFTTSGIVWLGDVEIDPSLNTRTSPVSKPLATRSLTTRSRRRRGDQPYAVAFRR